MSNSHAVLSLLDAPDGCDPAFFVMWAISANEEVSELPSWEIHRV